MARDRLEHGQAVRPRPAWGKRGIWGVGKVASWLFAVSRAFEAGRGLVLGIVLCGPAAALAITPPLAGYVFDTAGNHAALPILGVVGSLLSGLLALLLARDPGLGEEAGNGWWNSPPDALRAAIKPSRQARCAGLQWRQQGVAMKIDCVLRKFPSDFRMVLADVGSAGGLHGRWKPLRSVITALLFEPRDDLSEIRRIGNDIVFPIGLAPRTGRSVLNITALANMSSSLEPDAERLASYAKKGDHTRIVDRFEMPVDRLDAVLEREGITLDAIKVDTQGSELGILEGARNALETSVLMAEVEVSFFGRYREQALVWDIVAHMHALGFELLDLSRLKRYRRRNSAGIGNLSLGGGQRAGRLAYGDAIFFLREDVLERRLASALPDEAQAMVLKTVLGLLVYGKPDMAAHLFDRFGRFVAAPVHCGVAEWFGRMGRRTRGSGILHHAFDYLARHV